MPLEDDPYEEDADIGYAEGQSFAIEYRDSKGQLSARRITVWGLKSGIGSVPVLVATCHERRAQRTFRVDRILACVDYDGVVHDDVPAFLSETLGMTEAAATRTSKPEDAANWSRIRRLVQKEAILLTALSHSDGLMHQLEIEVTLRRCEQIIQKQGLYLNEACLRSLERYLRRLRPTERDIAEALEVVTRSDPRDIISFLTSSVHLIDADGIRHRDEVGLINDVSVELTGLPVVQ